MVENESDLSNQFDFFKIWAPVFAGIAAVAAALGLFFQPQVHQKLISEIEPGYQVSCPTEINDPKP